MRRLGLLAIAAIAISGCKSNPFCLNCEQGLVTADLFGTGMDLGGDLAQSQPDLTGMDVDGLCVASNGGVEACDGLDNDCNGRVDDVAADKLASDPNNCGACGTACDYTARHQFGACVNAVCMPTTCLPGFFDGDGMAANGCELMCTPTTPNTEVCDGRDNDCNGKVDDPFSATFQSDGTPNYDKDIDNCGQCAFACRLPGAVNKCVAGAGGLGACQVDHCINNPGVDTFKHNPTLDNPALGVNIHTTGCEYHCTFPSSTAGDCQAGAGSGCTFPVETCNGADDDCDFERDDNPTDADLNSACGKDCGVDIPAIQCTCQKGTVQCMSGVKQCVGSVGAGVETCDGKDNDCNGFVDDPFTAAHPGGYAGGNKAMPLYNSNISHCGACAQACNLPNAVNGCHSASAGALGNCFVVSCNSGFTYADKAQCGGGVAARDSSMGNNGGLGCYHPCAVPSTEVCDGNDNDCDGCTDEAAALMQPAYFCATQGACNGTTFLIECKGSSGWKCKYAGSAADVDTDANGNLKPLEDDCDGKDNNCNGFCDENFPNVATPNNATQCPSNFNRAAVACDRGVGICKRTGVNRCNAAETAEECSVTAASVAVNELCNGLDDDCDGRVDERTDDGGFLGWRDPVVAVTGGPSTVYVYQYEASRPDATLTVQGSATSRACSKPSVIPWSNVTQAQAAAACAAITDSGAAPGRLCTPAEWQRGCQGMTPSPAPTWGISSNTGSYATGICNDVNRANPDAVWATSTDGGNARDCYANWGGSNRLYDMSGNVYEWTSAFFTFDGKDYFEVRGGSYTSQEGGTTCEFDFFNLPTGFANANVGFRCCFGNAP